MPSKSKKQAIAMRIAAAGKSNLGIPPGVGRDYVEADKRKGTGNLPVRKGVKGKRGKTRGKG